MAYETQIRINRLQWCMQNRLAIYLLLALFVFMIVLFNTVPPKLLKIIEHKKNIGVNAINTGNRESSLNRPRLYLNSQKIESLKLKQGDYPYTKFWLAADKKAKEYIKKTPPASIKGIDENNLWKLGDGLPYLSLCYLVQRKPVYLDGARKWMDALCTYNDWGSNKDMGAATLLFNLSVAYDWLYDELTPDERKRYSGKIVKHAEILYRSLVKKDMWWARREYLMQNHNHCNVTSIAVAGLALRGERPEADAWLAAANSNFKEVLRLLSPDGASYEGVAYWGYGLDWLLKYFLSGHIPSGRQDIAKTPYFQNAARFRLYTSTPDYTEIVDYADSPRYEWVGPGYLLRALSSVFKDGRAQWLAERIEKARGKDAKYSWLDLIWYDESVRPTSPNDLPSFAYFNDLGIFIRRSNWTEKAVWCFFKAGPSLGKQAEAKGIYTGGHIHPDEGNFLLWAGGKWLVVDDGYVYKKRTENHNVLLFNGIGQLGEGKQWFNLYPVKKHKGSANIIFHDLQEDYQYLIAELAGMYPPAAGVKSWQRTFIALPRGRVVIRDSIIWNRPGRATSRVHFMSEPRRYATNTVCLGRKEGMVANVVFPRAAVLKIGKYTIAETERVRSTNYKGGLLEIEGDNTDTFILFLDPDNGGCEGEKDDLTVTPSGKYIAIVGRNGSTTIDFSARSVTINH